jgi:hypothetical protein
VCSIISYVHPSHPEPAERREAVFLRPSGQSSGQAPERAAFFCRVIRCLRENIIITTAKIASARFFASLRMTLGLL